MRAEKGQWQQHMNNSRMAKRGHKEGKKRAKPETVRMPKFVHPDFHLLGRQPTFQVRRPVLLL